MMAGHRLEALCNHTDAFRCVFMQLNLHTLSLNESVKKLMKFPAGVLTVETPKSRNTYIFIRLHKIIKGMQALCSHYAL